MLIITRLNALTSYRTSKQLLKTKQICNLYHIRCVANNKLSQENKTSHNHNQWTPIYFFPYIRIVAACSRLKLYQTAITLVAVPWSVSLYINNLVEVSSVGVISGCAIIACATLYLLSHYFRRLIGIIFLSKDEESVQISHLTFWGRKRDIVIPLQDVVPLAESVCNPTDIYIKLKRYSCEEELLFTLKYGNILDKMKFQKVFGDFKDFLKKENTIDSEN